LSEPPPTLSGLQRRLLELTVLGVAVSRVWARSRTLWDWDEALFALGVRAYDVTMHHPHPPGFPLYIALAKCVRLFVHSEFHSLQVITTIGAIALFPMFFWLARELHFPFGTAYLGGLLFVFLPNVWFFGGTVFSDVPALALQLAACAALVRGIRSRNAYFAGAVLLGLAAAMRPQALVIGCAPALVASWFRIREKRVRDVVTASAIGVAILAISYGGAALASESVAGYLDANHGLREYVRHVDSFLNPARQPLHTLLPLFFVHPIPGGRIAVLLSVLALLSLVASFVRRDQRVWLLAAMFLPFNVMGWFMLDVNSISRYSAGFAPMYALLAADGVAVVMLLAPAVAPLVEIGVLLGMTIRFAVWTIPAIVVARQTVSPPVAVMQWLRDNVRRPGPVYIHGSMGPFSDYFLPDYERVPVDDPAGMPLHPFAPNDWVIAEGASASAGRKTFVRDRGRLFDVARQRYFEVSAIAPTGFLRFADGWYDSESTGDTEWRWMGGHSRTLLPPVAGQARLALAFDMPLKLVAREPTVEVRLNGKLIDRFVCSTPSTQKSWVLPARADAWNELVISLDKVLNPAREGISSDARDLGLNLTSYAWGPAGQS
jgi:hypothetical protein